LTACDSCKKVECHLWWRIRRASAEAAERGLCTV
jgi:hypothetical protein